MEAKHTPGPWKAVTYSGAFDQPLITSDYGTIGRLHSFDNRQHEANARLIAAAPEMLKALRGVIHHNDGVKDQYKASPSLIDQVENAIKKATEI